MLLLKKSNDDLYSFVNFLLDLRGYYWVIGSKKTALNKLIKRQRITL